MEIDIGNVIIDEELNIGELQLDFIQNILHKPNQEKEVTPTKQEQTIFADTGYELGKVIVKPIPSEYIVPIGSVDITQNVTYNIADKAMANVNIPEKQLGTKTITKNGIYKATDDNLDGYSEVDVETSGVDINDYFKGTIERGTGLDIEHVGWAKTLLKFRSPLEIDGDSCRFMFANYPLEEIPQIDTSNVTNMYYMFYNCKNIKEIPVLNTANVTFMSYMFSGCRNLIKIPTLNTINVKIFEDTFRNCSKLTTVPLLKANAVNYIYVAFTHCDELTTIGGFENLGQAYEITQNANSQRYQLNLSYSTKLTHESLMNVLNNLYDIKAKGCKTQQLILGSTNIAKLTSEEIAIATNKGWTVS